MRVRSMRLSEKLKLLKTVRPVALGVGSAFVILLTTMYYTRTTNHCEFSIKHQSEELPKVMIHFPDHSAQQSRYDEQIKALASANAALIRQVQQLQAELRSLNAEGPAAVAEHSGDHEKNVPHRRASVAVPLAPAAQTAPSETSGVGAATTLPPLYRSMSQTIRTSMQGTCAKFLKRVPQHKRMLGIAGLFNTGTNLLCELLSRNCEFPGHNSSPETGTVLCQVPSGKHNHPHWQGKYWVSSREQFHWRQQKLRFEHMMSVVIVKDPLSWMNSMCKHKYAATGEWWRSHKCPIMHPPEDAHVDVRWVKGNSTQFATLLDFWADWYTEYLEVERPTIFVRYEDLLFDQETTIRGVCACGGATLRHPLVRVTKAIKDGGAGHGQGPAQANIGEAKALAIYSSAKQRLQRYSDEDLILIRGHAVAKRLMEKFGYFIPDVEASRQARGDYKSIPYPGDWCKNKDPKRVWCTW